MHLTVKTCRYIPRFYYSVGFIELLWEEKQWKKISCELLQEWVCSRSSMVNELLQQSKMQNIVYAVIPLMI